MTRNKSRKILNPRLDANFKAIFTQHTPESRCALKSFLTAAIGRNVVAVNVVENEDAKKFETERGIRYDINCEFEDGTKAQIEMQGSSKRIAFGKRVEYYVSRLMTSIPEVSDDWGNLPQVYQISVLNFNYDTSNTNPIHHYVMRDKKDGSEVSGLLNIIFMELPKVPEITDLNEVKNLPSAVKWCKFLQEADNPEKQDLIDKLAETEEGIMGAEKTLSKMSMDGWRWYFQATEWEKQMDYNTMIYGAQREARAKGLAEGLAEGRATGLAEGRATGLAEGRATGLAEGLAEGARENKIETARNLLNMNILSAEQISLAVSLPLEEVLAIKEELSREHA